MSYLLIDDPVMSDHTILISVEDLINRAMGRTSMNTVDFKMVKAVLHILARQQRVLQQRVEIKLTQQTPKDKDHSRQGLASDKVSLVPSDYSFTADSRRRTQSNSRAAIDVVTQSQFAILKADVEELKKNIAVPPPLKFPDNKQLKSQIADGSATLTEAMEVMQVDARVKAAEGAIGRTLDLLTLLAASGALPADLAQKLETLKISPGAPGEIPAAGLSQMPGTGLKQTWEAESARPSKRGDKKSTTPGITRGDFEQITADLREELRKSVEAKTVKSTAAAESALRMAQSVADKMETALNTNSRIDTLYSLVADYSNQLSGFDSGLTIQIQSIKEQITQIEADLLSGLKQLESANTNAETLAVAELTERYDDLAMQLDFSLNSHASLSTTQERLELELQGLVECVELLKELKCDRAEVLDGLKDKANANRLAGLLTVVEFERQRAELENRLKFCHEKFSKQESTWMDAINDLTKATDTKAQFLDLLAQRDDMQGQLRELDEKLRGLAMALGEPEAALLTRKLAKGALCGSCLEPAWMGARPLTAGVPPRLPPLRPPTPEPEPVQEVYQRDWTDAGRHMCHRWCGGSHTLVTENTVRVRASPPVAELPTKSYAGYGVDGRLYLMSEEMQPCAECNTFYPDTAGLGAGDAK